MRTGQGAVWRFVIVHCAKTSGCKRGRDSIFLVQELVILFQFHFFCLTVSSTDQCFPFSMLLIRLPWRLEGNPFRDLLFASFISYLLCLKTGLSVSLYAMGLTCILHTHAALRCISNLAAHHGNCFPTGQHAKLRSSFGAKISHQQELQCARKCTVCNT